MSLSGVIHIDNKNPCDRSMYIGTSTLPYKNTVRTICTSTKILIKEQLKSCFAIDVPKFANVLTFCINGDTDDALDECLVWFNGIIIKILVAIERKCKDILLFPNDGWEYNGLSASWSLMMSRSYSYVDYVAQEIINKSIELFTTSSVSFIIK